MTTERPESTPDPLNMRLDRLTLDLARLRGFLEHREPPRHKKPKLRVIKGGLAAFLAPFVVAGERLRDHLAVTTATAATAATVFAAPVLLTEPPMPAVAEPQISYLTNPSPAATASSVQAPRPLWGPPGLVSPSGPATPQPAGTPPGSPAPTSRLTLAESGAGESPAVLPPLPEPLPTLEPTPIPELEPTVTPTPEPTTTPTPVLSRSEAVAHCLGVLGMPPVGLAGCVEDSLS